MKPQKRYKNQPATIKLFNVVITFDTTKSDAELEVYSVELIQKMNECLKRHFPEELPQLSLDLPQNQKMKISIIPLDPDDAE
jgi:hypothetical protein